ncbi:MAG: hypothetical protein M1318_00125 [Firmicutes bacterium]|jgi:hypothetical protein|nr:hypothetical protein [Bacillota bacterium]
MDAHSSRKGYKRWLLLGPWLIIGTVSVRQLLSVRQPVTAEEWWGIAMVSLALLGMTLLQIAALRGKTNRFVRSRSR